MTAWQTLGEEWRPRLVIQGGILSGGLSLTVLAIVNLPDFDGASVVASAAIAGVLVVSLLSHLALPRAAARWMACPRPQALNGLALCHLPLYLLLVLLLQGAQPWVGGVCALVGGAVLVATAICLGALGPTTNSLSALARKLQGLGRPVATPGRERPRRHVVHLGVGLTCAALACAYTVHYRGLVRFEPGSFFGGDQWEYQSVAVNLARGHGFPTFGGVEDIAVYRFSPHDVVTHPELKQRFFAERSSHSGYFYRTPGYAFVLGTFYKLRGISPLDAKLAQLFLLVLVAALLPALGHAFWGWPGFAAGVVSGHRFLQDYHSIAGDLLTEPLETFCVFVLLVTLQLWHRRRSLATALLLGGVTGICLLIKGWFVLMPFLLAVELTWRIWKGTALTRHALAVFAVMALTLAPWSVYASLQSGQLILLSTQAKNVLLEGNNPRVAISGGWEPRGATAPDSFYRHPAVQDLSPLLQVGLFYAQAPSLLPRIAKQKIRAGFATYPFFNLLLVLASLELIVGARRAWRARSGRSGDGLVGSGVLFLVTALASLAVLQLVTRLGRPWLLPEDPNTALGLLLAALLLAAWHRPRPWSTLPLGVVVVIVLFVLMTLLTFGLPRFIVPLDFVCMLVVIRYGIHFAGQAAHALLDASRLACSPGPSIACADPAASAPG